MGYLFTRWRFASNSSIFHHSRAWVGSKSDLPTGFFTDSRRMRLWSAALSLPAGTATCVCLLLPPERGRIVVSIQPFTPIRKGDLQMKCYVCKRETTPKNSEECSQCGATVCHPCAAKIWSSDTPMRECPDCGAEFTPQPK